MDRIEDYSFQQTLLLRTPAYTVENLTRVENLYNDPFFRQAIAIASPTLNDELSKYQQWKSLPDTLKLVCRKYMNRMCFRPTPFGLCSIVYAAKWTNEKNKIILDRHGTVFCKTAYRDLKDVQPNAEYITNGSLYKIGDSYRYLFRQHKGDYDFEFLLRDAAASEWLVTIIDKCTQPVSYVTLCRLISEVLSLDPKGSRQLANELIMEQLLVLVKKRAIIAHKQDKILSISIEDIIRQGTGSLIALCDTLKTNNNTSSLYVNTTGKVASGGMKSGIQTQILQGMKYIHALKAGTTITQLDDFKKAFQQKYDQQRIPLLRALDPEIGLGYGKLDIDADNKTLSLPIANELPGNPQDAIQWTTVHKMLMNKWNKLKEHETVINIDESDVSISISRSSVSDRLPPGISVMFRQLGQQVYLESAGGSSAFSLAGRFTPFIPELKEMSIDIARKIESANPDVLFAEIMHINDIHTANIEYRHQIWRYALHVTHHDFVPDAFHMRLSDLSIFVHGTKLVLWCDTLDKQIIPVLSSAINYRRSALSIYRFLCDLQHQGLQTDFQFHPEQYFPGMDFYPRIQTETIILSLATWIIKPDTCVSYNDTKEMRQKLRALNMPQWLSVQNGDNHLVINLESYEDLLLLKQIAGKEKTVRLVEFPFVHSKDIADAQGNYYMHQCVAALYHEKQVYRPIEDIPAAIVTHPQQRAFLPGDEWLYCKIYCHVLRSNEMLLQILYPALSALGIPYHDCFFVRYTDPNYHIRIRIRLSGINLSSISEGLNHNLTNMLESGILHDFSINTYCRELERYTPLTMEASESLFCSGSEWIIQLLTRLTSLGSDEALEITAMYSLDFLCSYFFASTAERVGFFKTLNQNYVEKQQPTAAIRHQISANYRKSAVKLRQYDNSLSQYGQQHALPVPTKNLNNDLRNLVHLAQTLPSKKRKHLYADHLHMHLNRFFTAAWQLNEMKIYAFMEKYYRTLLSI